MGTLSAPDVATVLNSAEYQSLAVSAFDNDEMYRGVKAMKGDLKRSLIWMFDEGTDIAKVRDVINNATAGHDQVRTSMRAQFVDLCDNEEMAAMVDLLKGDLAFKLDWMREEGTSWSLVRPKIIIAAEAEKALIRASADWRAFFVDICDNDDMGLAVQLLGGDLEWKLGWIKAEGTNWQRLVQVIAGAPDGEKATIRNSPTWKAFFIEECNDEEMAKVVAAWAVTSSGGSAGCGRRTPTGRSSRGRSSSPGRREGGDPVERGLDEVVRRALQRPRRCPRPSTCSRARCWRSSPDEGRGRQLAERPREDRRDRRRAGEARRPPERRDEAVPRPACSNDEMADAVTLLGGDWSSSSPDEGGGRRLAAGEGAHRRRARATAAALRTDAWRAFFVEVCATRRWPRRSPCSAATC